MHLDQSRFPVVFIRHDDTPDITVEGQLEDLLADARPFVLITDHAPGDDHDETHEERKARALFFKRVKAQLQQLCRGIVIIEGERKVPLAIRLAAEGIGKALGLRTWFAASEEAAVARALEWLRT